MSTEHEPEDVTTPAGAHLALLIKRQWEQIAEILEEEGEVKITASIHITDRAPEEGNHADKDSRVKTTIAFSRKFSDSTESELADPRQPALDFDGRSAGESWKDEPAPDGYWAPPVNGTAPVAEAAEQPKEDGGEVAEQPQENAPWEEHADAEYPGVEPYAVEPATRAEMEGIVMSESPEPMVLTLADRLHAAAAGVPTPRVKVHFPPGFPPSKYRGLFRRAAKKQGWPEACIDLLDKVAEGAVQDEGPVCDGIRVLQVFAAHTEPEPPKVKRVKVESPEGERLPKIPFLVNPMTMDEPSRFMREFRRAASAAGWPENLVAVNMELLRSCDTVTEMYEQIREHIAEQKAEKAPEAPAGAEFAELPV